MEVDPQVEHSGHGVDATAPTRQALDRARRPCVQWPDQCRILSMDMLRIAVADDDPKIREAITEVLHNEGHEVLVFSTGTDLIRLLNEDPCGRPHRSGPVAIHLILLDLSMPETTGDDVLAFLARSRRYLHLPVVLITARREARLEVYREAYPNVVGLLRKPFGIADLLGAVAPVAARRCQRDAQPNVAQWAEDDEPTQPFGRLHVEPAGTS
jgi:CheY-like chemotaxis protein